MFSSRTRWNLSENQWSQQVTESKKHHGNLIDLTVSNPTIVGLSYREQEIINALTPRPPLIYEPTTTGYATARAAIAGYYAQRGVVATQERIFLTASTSDAYSHLFRVLCDPGDELLVPVPSYPLLPYLAQLDSLVIRPYLLDYDGEWSINWTSLEDGLRPQTKAIVVVSPNNPTGNYLTKGDRNRLATLAASRGLAIIVDEVFADYPLSETDAAERYITFDESCLCFGLHGLSKSVGLPQLKLSWIRVGGPKTLVADVAHRLEIVLDTFLSVATPVQSALPQILRAGQDIQNAIRQRIRANLRELLRLRTSDAPWTPFRIEGGWTQPIRLPAIYDDEQWACTFLQEYGCCVQPGFFYDFTPSPTIVVSLLVNERVFSRGISILDNVIRERIS